MKLSAILAAHWPRYVAASHDRHHRIPPAHHDAVAAVCACRTAALGGQRHDCKECSQTRFAYHSCNHRACPQCGGADAHAWAAAQEAKLLAGVPCFMLTFTLPGQMRDFARQHQRWFYDAMFAAMSGTLKDFAQDKKHLGGMAGLIQSPPPAPSPFRFAPGLLLRRSLSRGCRRRSAHRRAAHLDAADGVSSAPARHHARAGFA